MLKIKRCKNNSSIHFDYDFTPHGRERRKKVKNILITNNKMVSEKYGEEITLIYLDDLDMLKVLEVVRDKIHLGHELLTHPLSGSIKPNESPFKSVIISDEIGAINFESLRIIEDSIATARKFLSQKKVRDWPDRILNDFRVIDYSLIASGIESMNQCK